MPGIELGQLFVRRSGGKSLFVRDGSLPTSVYKVNLSTGQETSVMRLMPADPSGVFNVSTVVLSCDGKAYAYNYGRILSDLQFVEGLK